MFGFGAKRAAHDVVPVLIDVCRRGPRWTEETRVANCVSANFSTMMI